MTQHEKVEEITEEHSKIGPGQMLAQAREKMGLSQHDVAERLNFRTVLVSNLEQDIYDGSLPPTFNRGYLKSYAKLVDVSVTDVLASYEALNVVVKQSAQMQSFSKETEKQAENSRLMWLTYIILAALVGSSIVWWVQDAKQSQKTTVLDESSVSKNDSNTEKTPVTEQSLPLNSSDSVTGNQENNDNIAPLAETLKKTTAHVNNKDVNANQESVAPNASEQTEGKAEAITSVVTSNEPDKALIEDTVDVVLTSAQFTFSGDCWVNIYDATGERVAWGIKKTGYVMNISGQAPFKVTLGKPELVAISFQGDNIDMSQFSRGNIAKFTLPLDAEDQAE